MSHSGSRGLGANIAQHYTKIAMGTCKLPREVERLAWLDMDSEAGHEYWLSMNLSGCQHKNKRQGTNTPAFYVCQKNHLLREDIGIVRSFSAQVPVFEENGYFSLFEENGYFSLAT